MAFSFGFPRKLSVLASIVVSVLLVGCTVRKSGPGANPDKALQRFANLPIGKFAGKEQSLKDTWPILFLRGYHHSIPMRNAYAGVLSI